jgi:hypothetical protein
MAIVRMSTAPDEIPAEVWSALPEAVKIGLESLTPGERALWWGEYKRELEAASSEDEPMVWTMED